MRFVQDRAEWPAQELAAAVGLSADALRRRIMFWVNLVPTHAPLITLQRMLEHIQGPPQSCYTLASKRRLKA